MLFSDGEDSTLRMRNHKPIDNSQERKKMPIVSLILLIGSMLINIPNKRHVQRRGKRKNTIYR